MLERLKRAFAWVAEKVEGLIKPIVLDLWENHPRGMVITLATAAGVFVMAGGMYVLKTAFVAACFFTLSLGLAFVLYKPAFAFLQRYAMWVHVVAHSIPLFFLFSGAGAIMYISIEMASIMVSLLLYLSEPVFPYEVLERKEAQMESMAKDMYYAYAKHESNPSQRTADRKSDLETKYGALEESVAAMRKRIARDDEPGGTGEKDELLWQRIKRDYGPSPEDPPEDTKPPAE